MKKKIVYLLCELGLLKIAHGISPSLCCQWQGEKIAQAMREGIERVRNTMTALNIGVQEFAKQTNEQQEDEE